MNNLEEAQPTAKALPKAALVAQVSGLRSGRVAIL